MPPVRHDGAIHLDNRIALSLPTLVPATRPAWSQEDAQQLSQTQLQKNQAPLQ